MVFDELLNIIHVALAIGAQETELAIDLGYVLWTMSAQNLSYFCIKMIWFSISVIDAWLHVMHVALAIGSEDRVGHRTLATCFEKWVHNSFKIKVSIDSQNAAIVENAQAKMNVVKWVLALLASLLPLICVHLPPIQRFPFVCGMTARPKHKMH